MTDNKVTPLRVVPSIAAATDQEGLLQSIATFLRDEGILDEWSEDDVELEYPKSDEIKLGELTAVERQFFVIGQLMNEIIREEMVELEASNSDKITAIMREKKISMAEAAQIFAQDHQNHMSDDQRRLLNQCSMTMGNVLTIYEWSIRVRSNQWDKPIIIRRGFQAYCYG